MSTIRIPRRLVAAAGGTFIALAPMTIAGAPHAIAQGCQDSEIEDSYSLQCVPSTVPDFNDQLTEAEVAEPGFNAHPGGGGGGGGGGHR
jgi:hypothetical protein